MTDPRSELARDPTESNLQDSPCAYALESLYIRDRGQGLILSYNILPV
jgi:hypothetical protein